MKIKIVHVIGSMSLGGIETSLLTLLSGINRERFDLELVVHGNNIGNLESKIKELGIDIKRAPKYSVINHLSYVRFWSSYFSHQSDSKNIIIHCHIRSTASIILREVSKYPNMKGISHSHGVYNGTGIVGIIKEKLQNKIVNYSDLNLACSKEAGEWLFKDRPFSIFYNSLHISKYFYKENSKSILGFPQETLVLGTVGRLVTEKNQIFLLDLIEKLVQNDTNVHLVLIGEGNIRRFLEKEIDTRKLNSYVSLLGNRNDVHLILNELDIFMLPSIKEGLGIAVIEAQINGLHSLISSQVPDEVDIGVNLLKKLELNLEEWYTAVLEIKKLGKYSRLIQRNKNIDRYDVSLEMNRIEAMYQDLVKTNND